MNTAPINDPAVQGRALATGNTFLPQRQMERMQIARELARSRQIPPSLQNSPGDVYMALEICDNFNLLFPLAVWEISLIKGRAMFGGKLCAAMLHNSGRLAERLSYSYAGEGDDMVCTARARLNGENEARTVEVELKKVKNDHNANWKNDPKTQLSYSAARRWGRVHAPEVILGALFEGETIDVTPTEISERTVHPSMREERRSENLAIDTAALTLEELNARDQAAAGAPTEQVTPHAIARTGDTGADWKAWMDKLRAYVRAAPDVDTINNWTTENFDHLAQLQVRAPQRSKELIDEINAEIEKRTEHDARGAS